MEAKKFWRAIKEWREDHDIIQATVAEKLGIPRYNYIKWEKGQNGEPTDEFLANLAEAIGMTYDEIKSKYEELTNEDAESNLVSLDHLPPEIREIVANREYAEIVKVAIVKYLADMARQSLKK